VHAPEPTHALERGVVVLRRTEREVMNVVDHIRRINRGWDEEPTQAGTPDQIVERLAPYLDQGFHSMHVDFPPPLYRETLELLATEVRSGLVAALRG
jgi:alkanesulfonate monooxygenase SsuD/methylene tetrahydromethanopterin reductase-like flavin-dependent oxidoreductase (luciferase family)